MTTRARLPADKYRLPDTALDKRKQFNEQVEFEKQQNVVLLETVQNNLETEGVTDEVNPAINGIEFEDSLVFSQHTWPFKLEMSMNVMIPV